MLKFIMPHLRLARIVDLTSQRLRELEIEHLLLDMDCTLKDYHAAAVGDEVIEWARRLQAEGITLCILSNGRAGRIAPLAASMGAPFVAKAFKPLPFGCRRAVAHLGLDPRRTAVVGDQVFADIMAGRWAGLFTILVVPTSPAEPWFTRLKRPLERWVLRRANCVPHPNRRHNMNTSHEHARERY